MGRCSATRRSAAWSSWRRCRWGSRASSRCGATSRRWRRRSSRSSTWASSKGARSLSAAASRSSGWKLHGWRSRIDRCCAPDSRAYDARRASGRGARTREMSEPTEFGVDSWRASGAFVVAPRGEVDLATASSVRAALDTREPSDAAVLLDLRAVEFIDTSGLRVVVEQAHRAQAGGYRFAVVRGSPQVQRIFDVAGLSPELLVDDPAEVTGGGGPQA